MAVVLRILTETLIPVLFVLGLGYYAGARGRVDNRSTASISSLLMQFTLPCALFLAIARTSTTLLRAQLPLLAIFTIAMGSTYALQFYLDRRVFQAPIKDASTHSLTSSFGNNVAVGLPLLLTLYGPAGLPAVVTSIVVGALLVSPITLVLMECNTGTDAPLLSRQFGLACFGALKKPVVLAPIAGLLVLFLGVKLPSAIVNSVDLIGKSTIGLALFLTGLLLSAEPLRVSSRVLSGMLLKNFVQPAIAVVLVLLFRIHGDLGREALLLAALPAGFFGTVFGARYKVRSVEVNSTLVLSTAISFITLPVIYLLSQYLP
jgi:malonate transporter